MTEKDWRGRVAGQGIRTKEEPGSNPERKAGLFQHNSYPDEGMTRIRHFYPTLDGMYAAVVPILSQTQNWLKIRTDCADFQLRHGK
jgi:hypothetical protein